METFANALIASSQDFLLQKNLWLEKATLATEEITKQLQQAREAAYASPPVKKAEAELEGVVKQNEAEVAAQQKAREEYQKQQTAWQEQNQQAQRVHAMYARPFPYHPASAPPSSPPDARAAHHAQMERLRKATEAVQVAKAASLETESYKALCAEHATLHGILAEARRSRAEAETFTKIFTAICQNTLETLSKKTA